MSDPLEIPTLQGRRGSQLGIVVVGAVAAWRLSQARSRRRAAAPVLPEPAVELAS